MRRDQNGAGWARLAPILALDISLPWSAPAAANRQANGFDLDRASIPVDEIVRGGPPRDGIPALRNPERLPASDSPWLDSDWILGVEIEGEARAYPLAILIWHEVVNDELGGRPILISYCPLCGTGLVFDRRVANRVRQFGVSGLLYRSDMLMFDRESQSLWSQISAQAVTGPSRGARLTLLRSQMMPWGHWRASHPQTSVLSRETGYRRRYGHSPYGDYEHSARLLFPARRDPRFHPKMPTLGLRVAGGAARAYPADEVAKAGGRVRERFAGRDVEVEWDARSGVFHYRLPEEIEVVRGFWFAWMAFHPESSVYRASPSATASGESTDR